MITERDLVVLSFTPDLSEAGLVYARRVLGKSRASGSSNPYDAIRRTAASGAVNLALRRHFVQRGIAFGVKRTTPFLDPERYDLEVGGRACELKVYLISRSAQWQALMKDRRLALDAPALVPLDRHTSETVRGGDVYVFAFVGAGAGERDPFAATGGSTAGESWMHVMPLAWSRERGRLPLGVVAIETPPNESTTLGFVGEDLAGAQHEPTLQLKGQNTGEIDKPLQALHYVFSRSRPTAPVQIRASSRRLVHIIEPADWINVRPEGWGILLLGWLTRQEFRTRAQLIPAGRRVFQFDRTKTKNLGVAVAHLKPIADLPGTLKGHLSPS